ncbi:unnamed protein product [Prorocentrum cordatum]|uniref:Uncharacterized protein n=1 Tax=Prorocentrum cordatum TaxID=2364126 RepID=A0ABN9YDA6_9DINO|nr:unnamed protein product [Polarella glacialis]
MLASGHPGGGGEGRVIGLGSHGAASSACRRARRQREGSHGCLGPSPLSIVFLSSTAVTQEGGGRREEGGSVEIPSVTISPRAALVARPAPRLPVSCSVIFYSPAIVYSLIAIFVYKCLTSVGQLATAS